MLTEFLQLLQVYPWWFIIFLIILLFFISLVRKLGDKLGDILGDEICAVIKRKLGKEQED